MHIFLYIIFLNWKKLYQNKSGGFVMNTSINKKVICVKDIPSNLIEEAIFILKSDVRANENKKTELIRKEIILKETEDFLKEYSDEFEEIEINEEENNNILNNFKFKILLGGILVASLGYLISLII